MRPHVCIHICGTNAVFVQANRIHCSCKHRFYVFRQASTNSSTVASDANPARRPLSGRPAEGCSPFLSARVPKRKCSPARPIACPPKKTAATSPPLQTGSLGLLMAVVQNSTLCSARAWRLLRRSRSQRRSKVALRRSRSIRVLRRHTLHLRHPDRRACRNAAVCPHCMRCSL